MTASACTGSPADVHLQVGFDGGSQFLARWQRWRNEPAASKRAMCHVTIASVADAATAPPAVIATHDPLMQQLACAWPPRVHGLHRLSFENGKVQLLLALGEPRRWLTQLRLQADGVDLIDIDRLAATPTDLLPLARALARLCRHGAALHGVPASIDAASAFASAGFECSPFVAGEPMRGRFAPRFEVRRQPSFAGPDDGNREAIIVGAGLAGCALAWALAEHGWRTWLIDRHAEPAQEASGNPAGMFCGTVHPHDGHHARWQRAAALEAQRAVRFAIDHHAVAGATDGVVRLDRSGRTRDQMQAMLERLALPGDFVQALDAEQASARCGVQLRYPAWFFAGGGWVQPGGLARSMLRRAGPMAQMLGGRSAQAIQSVRARWQVRDGAGALIASAPTLVLANAGDALRLLQAHGSHVWPVGAVRGQLSWYEAAVAPRLPLAGGGYWLPATGGLSVFGASAQAADLDPEVRIDDHAHNLHRLHGLSPNAPALVTGELQGRVAWRCVAADRLPVIGPVPDPQAPPGSRLHHLARLPGLHVITALGSRGISSAVLGGQVLAAQISGAPVPLEAKLVDAIEPARFAMRAARRR